MVNPALTATYMMLLLLLTLMLLLLFVGLLIVVVMVVMQTAGCSILSLSTKDRTKPKAKIRHVVREIYGQTDRHAHRNTPLS